MDENEEKSYSKLSTLGLWFGLLLIVGLGILLIKINNNKLDSKKDLKIDLNIIKKK